MQCSSHASPLQFLKIVKEVGRSVLLPPLIRWVVASGRRRKWATNRRMYSTWGGLLKVRFKRCDM